MKVFLFPIFLPFVAWAWLLAFIDMTFGFSGETSDTGPTASSWATVGYFVLVAVIAAALQATAGLFSRLILRRARRLRTHLAFGAGLAFVLAVGAAFLLRHPPFGETLRLLLPFTLLFFVPPLLVGHYYAFADTRHSPSA